MPYQYSLIYQPRKDDLNPADYLSRHPHHKSKRDNAAEAYIRYVTQHAIPKSIPLGEVKQATEEDPLLQKMMDAISHWHWYDQQLSRFVQFKDELSTHDGLILRGHRLAIPSMLQKKTVDIAHHSHQGIVKTKQLTKEKVWFPGIDKLVEDIVCNCLPCQASKLTHSHREPIHTTPLPIGPSPWTLPVLFRVEIIY